MIAAIILSVAFLMFPGHAPSKHPKKPSNAHVIRHVFGKYGGQAIKVAYCESRLQTTARNGQYLGLFQMGSWERRKYGHGPTALQQARSAFRYFKATGRDWSPWSCRWAAA